MDDISNKVSLRTLRQNITTDGYQVYEAMAYHVTQANFNRRVKVVGAWSLQMTASAILSALRSMMDPMAKQLNELYTEGIPPGIVFPMGVISADGP